MIREERLNDPEESLRLALESHQAQMWTALPGIVSGVDLAKQTVSVQPSVKGSVTDAQGNVTSVNMPVLVDVPLCWPKAGGFALTFPVKAGDEVLVVFSSRCIDSWWQSGGVGAPAEARMHDLSDGFAIIAPTSQAKKYSNVSSTNVQLRNETGNTYVEITPDGKARVIGATAIDLNAPTINITGDNINLTGTMTMAGRMVQTGTMSIGGVEFGTHKHTGVQPGSGTSGGPTN